MDHFYALSKHHWPSRCAHTGLFTMHGRLLFTWPLSDPFAFLRGVVAECVDRIQELFAKRERFSTLVARAYGAFSKDCSHIRTHADRRDAASDVAGDLYLALKSACDGGGIQDFEPYLRTSLFNAVRKRCQEAAKRVGLSEENHAPMVRPKLEELSDADFERILLAAIALMKDARNAILLRMYVDGKSNAEMREADDRSDRTMNRLRNEVFPDVLNRAYLRFTT